MMRLIEVNRVISLARPDYNVGSLSNILDMVKVMQFALSEGKVAIHCHAGLGEFYPGLWKTVDFTPNSPGLNPELNPEPS